MSTRRRIVVAGLRHPRQVDCERVPAVRSLRHRGIRRKRERGFNVPFDARKFRQKLDELDLGFHMEGVRGKGW